MAEKEEQLRRHLYARAEKTLSSAKTELLKNARSGNYITANDKTIVKAYVWIESEYFRLTIEKQPCKYQRKMFGKVVVSEPAKVISTLELDPDRYDDFCYFFENLKNMAEDEKISIKGYFIEHSSKHTREALPYRYEDPVMQLFKHEWQLMVEFEATI